MTFVLDQFGAFVLVISWFLALLICLAGMSAPQEWPTDEDGNPVRGATKKHCPKHPGTAKCVCRGDKFGGRNRP